MAPICFCTPRRSALSSRIWAACTGSEGTRTATASSIAVIRSRRSSSRRFQVSSASRTLSFSPAVAKSRSSPAAAGSRCAGNSARNASAMAAPSVEGGVAEPVQPAGLAEQHRRPARYRQYPGEPAPSRQVDQVGEVLAAEDLDGGQVAAGRHDLARDHVPGFGEEVLLAFPAPGEGDQERVPGAPPGAARPLHVAGRAARHRGEDDRGQVADVDAEFQGRGAGQDVRVVVPGAVAESPLHPFALSAGHGADVLGGDHLVRMPLGVQLTVIVLLVLPVGRRGERPGAPVPGARLADPFGAPFRVDDLLPVAGVAAERRARDLGGVQQPDRDVTGPQPVDAGGAVTRRPHREHVLVREELQQPGQVERRLLRADPEAARGPVHVPALTGVRGVELAAPLALAGQEPGRRDTAAGTRACRPDGVPRSRRNASSRPGRASSPASGG